MTTPAFVQRGVVRDKEAATQLQSFEGLRIGNATPTDIDCFLEIRNRAYVVVEMKHRNGLMPYGQQLALERLARDLRQSVGSDGRPKLVLLIVAAHDCKKTDVVLVREARVRQFDAGAGWQLPSPEVSVHAMVARWLSKHGLPPLELA